MYEVGIFLISEDMSTICITHVRLLNILNLFEGGDLSHKYDGSSFKVPNISLSIGYFSYLPQLYETNKIPHYVWRLHSSSQV